MDAKSHPDGYVRPESAEYVRNVDSMYCEDDDTGDHPRSPTMQKSRLWAIRGTNSTLGAKAMKIGVFNLLKSPWLNNEIACLAPEGWYDWSGTPTGSVMDLEAMEFSESCPFPAISEITVCGASFPDKGKRLATSTGYGYNSSCGETSTKHHDPYVPEVCINILNGNNKIDPAKGNHGCTELIHQLQWNEHIHSFAFSKGQV